MAVSREASFHASVIFSGQMMALCLCVSRVGDRAELSRWAGGWRKVGVGPKVASEKRGRKEPIPDSLGRSNVWQVGTGREFLVLSSAKSQALKKYMCQGVYRSNL